MTILPRKTNLSIQMMNGKEVWIKVLNASVRGWRVGEYVYGYLPKGTPFKASM